MSDLLQTECYHIENNPDFAAALAALGFSVVPTKNADHSAPSAATNVVVGFRSSPSSRDRSLNAHDLAEFIRNDSIPPDHPLRAAILGIRARRYLGQWRDGKASKPHVVIVPKNRLAAAMYPTDRTRNYDISPHLQLENDPDPLVMNLDHAAAAIVAMHGIGQMTPLGLQITQRSGFHPSQRASTLAAACTAIAANPTAVSTTSLPGAAPGEHPFLYALMGIQCARVLTEAAKAMAPTWKFSARHGSKFALVDERLLDQPGPFKDHMHRHLK